MNIGEAYAAVGFNSDLKSPGKKSMYFIRMGTQVNRKRSLVGGPVVVHASAARCLLRGPFCISLPIGIVE